MIKKMNNKIKIRRNQIFKIISKFGGFWNSKANRPPQPIFNWYDYRGGFPEISDYIGTLKPGPRKTVNSNDDYENSLVKYPLILLRHGEIMEKDKVEKLIQELENIGIERDRVKILCSNLAEKSHPNIIGCNSEFYKVEYLLRKKYLFGDVLPYKNKFIKYLRDTKKSKKFLALCATLHTHRKFCLNEIFRRKLLKFGYISAWFGIEEEMQTFKNMKTDEDLNDLHNVHILRQSHLDDLPEHKYPYKFKMKDWKKIPLILDMVLFEQPNKKFLNYYNPYDAVELDGFLAEDTNRWVDYSQFEETEIRATLKGEFPTIQDKMAIPHKYFKDSYFSIVLDSYMDGPGGINEFKFITEKVYRALLVHPIIVVGQFGTLKKLRSMGFETFPELFNEEYDLIEDVYDRFMFIMNEVERVCRLPDEVLHEKYVSVLPKIKHNQQIFYNSKEQIHKEMDKIIKELAS